MAVPVKVCGHRKTMLRGARMKNAALVRPIVTAACAAFALSHLLTQTAQAQDYPTKAVRIIVPFAPGGPNDLAVRPVAQKLYELLGQPFVIDYRAGANGIIGCELVAKAPPDGYSMVVISSSFSINSSTYAKLPFDPIRDFAPVGSLATSDIIYIINPTVPVKSVKEFVALAKANPGKLTHGSSGTGGSLHLGAELFKQSAGVNMVHIPYKGAALALTDVIGGHVDSMFISAPGAVGQIKAGKVRVLAIASPRRARALPDAPTFAEAGYPEVVVDTRYGLLAPASTPAGPIARLEAAIAKALAMPDVREQFATLSLDPAPMSPQDYGAFLREEISRWRKVVAAAKLQPQ
jgi:tripartite-type tricarboxylate transporter receptor subunit TctC